jgi:hypothetical protein
LANGSYTVTPVKTGFTFAPPNQTVAVNSANLASVNFTAQPVTWSLSGTISGGSGATVNLSGTSTATTTANGSGNYTFSGLANGNYSVTPAGPDLVFTPTSQPVTINGANVTGINFAGQDPPPPASIQVDAKASFDQMSKSLSLTSTVFSTNSANELLLAFIATDYNASNGGPNTTVTSVTGAGLTWQLVGRTNVQNGDSEIWRTFSPAPLRNVSVTANLSQSVVSSITVMSFTGADPSGLNGSGAIGAIAKINSRSAAPHAGLTTTSNNSLVVGVGNDWYGAIPRTPATGQVLVHQALPNTHGVGTDTFWVQMQSAVTPQSGTLVTINDTAPSYDGYNLTICEILAAPPVTAQGSTL